MISFRQHLSETQVIKASFGNMWKNPNHEDMKSLIGRYHSLRGLITTNKNLYVANANTAIHNQMKEYVEGDIDYYLYFTASSSTMRNMIGSDKFEHFDGIDVVSYDHVAEYNGASRTVEQVNNPKLNRAMGVPNKNVAGVHGN